MLHNQVYAIMDKKNSGKFGTNEWLIEIQNKRKTSHNNPSLSTYFNKLLY